MNDPMNKKMELCLLIENFLTNSQQLVPVAPGTYRYFESFLLLLKKEDKNKIKDFLAAVTPLLKKKRFPFLSLNTMIFLFEKWKLYNGIIRDLTTVSLRLKKTILQEDFWYLIIRISSSELSQLTCKESQLTLLTCMINNDILNEGDLKSNYSIIQAILQSNVKREDLVILRNNLKEDSETPYWAMFQHILLMKQKGVSALEINEMIKIHFGPLTKTVKTTEEYKSFLHVLYEKLPANFMTVLYHNDVSKLFFIYSHNPQIFNTWQPEIGDRIMIDRLIRSLFSEFIVSDVFLERFSRDRIYEIEKKWFAHVLQGRNIVQAEGLPIILTKKAAHIFRCMEARELSVTRSLIYAGIEAIVNDEYYSRQVINGIREDGQAEFWVKTMSILHKNGLSSRYVTEVMDYIRHKVFIEGVQLEIKHKKVQNLLTDMRNWHQQMNEMSIKRPQNRKLPDAGIDDLKIDFGGKEYEITQLRKFSELYQEGKVLNHCVYTYRNYCLNKRCFIFSLRLIKSEDVKSPLITLEIQGNQIVQAKGKYNRKPTEIERTLIQIWANEKDLRLVS
jgi:hypothetical protein